MATQIVEFPQTAIPQAQTKAEAPRPVLTRTKMVHLTPDELLAVLKVARERSSRDWAMIVVAYRHGMRASELCGIRIMDVDLESGSIDIRRLKGSLHTIQPLYRHKGQPLLDEVLALRTWLKERKADGSDYLFLSQKGGKLGRVQFFRVFKACAQGSRATVTEMPSTRTEALAGHSPGLRERESRLGEAVPGPQGDRKHDEVRRGYGRPDGRGSAGGADADVLR
jgi:site-specific recombinase XerD